MKLLPPCLALGLFSLSRLALAQDVEVDPDDPDHGVAWVYPPRSEKDLTFHYLDTIEVQWTSPFPDPQLFTFCTSPEDGSPVRE